VCAVTGLYNNRQQSADNAGWHHATVSRDGAGESPLAGYESDGMIRGPVHRGDKTETTELTSV